MASSMSGISVSETCMAAFEEVKKRRCRFVIYSITGDEVTVKGSGERNLTYDEFLGRLGQNEPAYIVYDMEYPRNGVTASKLVFISWIPDSASTRLKMIYASTKEALKAKIESSLVELQATDNSEISHKEVLARVQKF